MIKKFLSTACLLLSLVSFAQEGTSSPYSFYGIGDVRFKGTQENRSMAGIAIEQDSIHINLENPAAYASLKLTTFSLGATYGTKMIKNASASAYTRASALDYLAVGLPLGKFGVGFGLIPYSSVGYKIESLAVLAGETNKRLTGSGGLNKVFLGVGYKIRPNFTIGADVNYNFGKIQTSSLEFISNVSDGTQELNSAILTGVNFNIGSMFQTKISKKLSFFSSLNFALESKINSQNTRNISAVVFNSAFNVQVVDATTDVTNQVKMIFPSKFTLGAGIGEARKWLVGTKVSFQKNAGTGNSYNQRANVTYGQYTSLSLGGYFIPDYNSFTNYAKRVVYRGGLKYEKTGLIINSQSINDLGLTFGIGLPINGTFSNINIGFEYGKRGTTTSGLIQENYSNINVGFSLNDRWFEKRKFN